MKNTHLEKAQGACPSGWHLPSDAEWIQLFNAISDSNSCSFALKDTNTNYWVQPLIASNTSGFSIVGAGSGYNCSFFDLKGTHAEFWTSTEIDNNEAKNWSTNNQSGYMFRHYNQDKPNNFSIRCVRNLAAGINESDGEFNEEFLVNYSESNQIIVSSRKQNIAREFTYSLISIEGKQIRKSTFNNSIIIDLQSLSNGLYLLTINQENKFYYKKIIIE